LEGTVLSKFKGVVLIMMNELPKINVIEETSFLKAWQRAAVFIDESGVSREIGGPKEDNPKNIERKKIMDTRQTIIMTGKALIQMKNGDMHPKFPWTPKKLEEYCQQLTPEYTEYWNSLPEGDQHKFKYIYRGRLDKQLDGMRENLAIQINAQISSNRTQATTWDGKKDPFNDEPPCFQRVQIMYLGQDESGVGYVEVCSDWRSRNIFAWQSNKICITRMLYREVLTPNNCIIVRDIDQCASLHCAVDSLSSLHEAAYYNRIGNNLLID
jgi:hypothetical protein